MAPKDVRCLTPAKLAAFYKEVGGDLDGSCPFFVCAVEIKGLILMVV
jgi:hypothetical protein